MKREQQRAIVVAFGIFLLLALSNPSHETHRQKIKEAIVESQGPLLGSLTIGHRFSRHNNYIIFSTTDIFGQTSTVGFLGMVFVMDWVE